MRGFSAVLGAISLMAVSGAAAVTDGRIDRLSVWSGGDLSICRPIADDSRQRSCLIRVMRTSGASPKAIAFIRNYKDLAYVSKFTAFGPVDLAVATSPFMANSNDAFILVNGQPQIVDVAEQANSLSKRPAFFAFRRRHPSADLWPLDGEFAGAEPYQAKGRRFVFSMPFKTCHACAIVAVARLAYDFDRTGSFRGVSLVSIRPAR